MELVALGEIVEGGVAGVLYVMPIHVAFQNDPPGGISRHGPAEPLPVRKEYTRDGAGIRRLVEGCFRPAEISLSAFAVPAEEFQ